MKQKEIRQRIRERLLEQIKQGYDIYTPKGELLVYSHGVYNIKSFKKRKRKGGLDV